VFSTVLPIHHAHRHLSHLLRLAVWSISQSVSPVYCAAQIKSVTMV
jgi:hypothetical protein